MESLTSTLPEGGVGLRLDAREIDEPPSSTGSAAFSTAKDGDTMAEEELVEDALRKVVDEIRPENIHVTLSKLHYGMGDKNPLDFIRFYTKQRPNGTTLLSLKHLLGLADNKVASFYCRMSTVERGSGIGADAFEVWRGPCSNLYDRYPARILSRLDEPRSLSH